MWNYLNLMLFVFSNGNKISDFSLAEVAKFKEFVQGLIDDYKNQPAGLMKSESDDAIAAKYPEIAAKIQAYHATQPVTYGAAIGGGNLKDFIQMLLDNQEKIMQFINMILQLGQLFNPPSPVPTPTPTPTPPPTPTA